MIQTKNIVANYIEPGMRVVTTFRAIDDFELHEVRNVVRRPGVVFLHLTHPDGWGYVLRKAAGALVPVFA